MTTVQRVEIYPALVVLAEREREERVVRAGL